MVPEPASSLGMEGVSCLLAFPCARAGAHCCVQHPLMARTLYLETDVLAMGLDEKDVDALLPACAIKDHMAVRQKEFMKKFLNCRKTNQMPYSL